MGLSVKLPFTVRVTVACSLNGPLVPVIVMVEVPMAAVAFADNVRTLADGELEGLNVAETPLGTPVAANTTLPAKLPFGTTVIVDVPLVR